MKHYYKELPGENWFDYESLYKEMVDKFPSGSHFVEVGSWKGRSTCYMGVELANSGKKIKFDCVDTWTPIATEKDIPEELYNDLFSTFLANIAPVREYVNPVKGVSWEAASFYADESLDFVFIDAAHDYASVIKDITSWYPKVKKGGIIAGHDYTSSGVYRAVQDFFADKKAPIQKGICWLVNVEKPLTFENYKDIKGYVINLDRERWRYDVTRKELTGLGFTNIHRWKATDYREEDVETEMRILGATRLDRFYNCAEMSCLLSHFRVFHDFLISKEPYCLVFEDDVVAVPDFKELSDLHDIHFGEFDLLSFGGPYAAPSYDRWVPEVDFWNTTNWEPVLKAEQAGASHVNDCCFWQSHAYMLSRKGAYTLLQDYPAWASSVEYRIPFMDVYMSSNRRIKNKLLINKNIANPEQYGVGDQFGERFRGIMFQRGSFKSTIVKAHQNE